MSRKNLPLTMTVPTHDQGNKKCIVCTSVAIHTTTLGDESFASIALNQPEAPVGAVAFLDRAEVEAHIALLQNAIDDAGNLNAGRAVEHAAPSLIRN